MACARAVAGCRFQAVTGDLVVAQRGMADLHGVTFAQVLRSSIKGDPRCTERQLHTASTVVLISFPERQPFRTDCLARSFTLGGVRGRVYPRLERGAGASQQAGRARLPACYFDMIGGKLSSLCPSFMRYATGNCPEKSEA